MIWAGALSPLICGTDMSWLVFIVNLAQPRDTWEEGTPTEEFPQSVWPLGMPVWHFLDY